MFIAIFISLFYTFIPVYSHWDETGCCAATVSLESNSKAADLTDQHNSNQRQSPAATGLQQKNKCLGFSGTWLQSTAADV